MYKIKKFENRYNEEVNNFIISVFVDEFGFEECRKELEEQDNYEYIQNGGRLWIALDDDDNVIGTIGLKKHSDDDVELKKLYVRKDYRGKGVSKELYNTMLEESKKDSELGRYISEVLSSGGLVKDEVTYELLKTRLSQDDCKNGYILDGFPRNIEQAYKYDEILNSLNQELGYVIQLDISEEILEKRITGRRICEDCGSVYNINSDNEKPKQESICDKCNGKLYQRNDDNITSFKNRYNLYIEKTKPLLDYYAKKGILYVINGNDSVEEVSKRIDAVLKKGM